MKTLALSVTILTVLLVAFGADAIAAVEAGGTITGMVN